MKVKTCPVQIKAAGSDDGADEGVFEAIVAAYNVDSVNDRIMPGAFKKSLDSWNASGDPIPVLWAHKSDDPDYHIGQVLEAEERPEGLWVKARLDLDEPKSKKIFKLLKGRRIRSFSFSYDIVSAKPGKKDDGGDVQELHELHIHEIGPCLIPANRETALLGVKNDAPAPAVTVMLGERDITDLIGDQVRSRMDELAKSLADASDDEPELAPAARFTAIATEMKTTGAMSKEHQDQIASAFAAVAAGMEAISNFMTVFDPSEDTEPPEDPRKAAPAPPAPDETPVRPATPNTVLLDVLELEHAADSY